MEARLREPGKWCLQKRCKYLPRSLPSIKFELKPPPISDGRSTLLTSGMYCNWWFGSPCPAQQAESPPDLLAFLACPWRWVPGQVVDGGFFHLAHVLQLLRFRDCSLSRVRTSGEAHSEFLISPIATIDLITSLSICLWPHLICPLRFQRPFAGPRGKPVNFPC